MPRTPSLLLALALLPAALRAEEEPATEIRPAGPTPAALYSRALLEFRDRDDLVVRATIRDEAPAAAARPGGAGQPGQIIMVGPGQSEPPFEGAVEVWRGADGAIVVLSEKRLPGLALFRGPERTIVEQTYEASPAGIDRLDAELCAIVEKQRFLGHFRDAKLVHSVDADGRHHFRGEISREILRKPKGRELGGGMLVLSPATRVLRIEADVVVGAKGELRSVALRVVRSKTASPLAGMQVRFGGQGGQVEVAQDDDKKEGGSTVYALDFGVERPSRRAREFRERMRALVAPEPERTNQNEPGSD